MLDSSSSAWIGLRNSYLRELETHLCWNQCKGERPYNWAAASDRRMGWERTLLVRRSIDDPTEYAYYLTLYPATQKHTENTSSLRWMALGHRNSLLGDQGECGLSLINRKGGIWVAIVFGDSQPDLEGFSF
jgi:hypothetical protein